VSQQEFESYLELLCRLLKVAPEQRQQVAEEFRAHLEDRLSDLSARGMPHEKAVQQALGEFGDAAALAAELAQIAQRRRRRFIMRVSFATVAALAAIVLLAIALWPEGRRVTGPARAVAQVDAGAKAGRLAERQSPLDAEAAARRRIEEALNQTIELQFRDVPLKDVIAEVAKKARLPIRHSARALDDAAISLDTPVNYSIEGVSLRSALRMMLRDIGLTYVFRNEVLHVTTPDDAESELVTRVYDCRELLALASPIAADGQRDPSVSLSPSSPPANKGGAPPAGAAPPAAGNANAAPVVGCGSVARAQPFNPLINLITTTVEPNTWEEFGGPGAIAEYKGLLAIAQTDEVHEKVERLLNMLHRAAELKDQRVKVVE
jgi:hypothetical protein